MPNVNLIQTDWQDLPGTMPAEQIFAIGDIHGQADAMAAALVQVASTPSIGLPRRIVFLGDFIDRGPASLACLAMAADAAHLAAVDTVDILMGNHEILLAEALANPDRCMWLWLRNGGWAVLAEIDPEMGEVTFAEMADVVRKALPAPFDGPLVGPGARLQSHLHLGDLLFVHAGISPHMDRVSFLAKPPACDRDSHWAWIRDEFLRWTGKWNPEGTLTVLHGHTPFLREWVTTADDLDELALLVSARGRVCLDAGAASGFGQVAIAELAHDRIRLHLVQTDRPVD